MMVPRTPRRVVSERTRAAGGKQAATLILPDDPLYSSTSWNRNSRLGASQCPANGGLRYPEVARYFRLSLSARVLLSGQCHLCTA